MLRSGISQKQLPNEGQSIRAKRSIEDQALKVSVLDQFSLVQPESGSRNLRSVQFKTGVLVSSSNQSSQCTLAISRTSININNSSREEVNSLLKQEILYRAILKEMESKRKNEIVRRKEIYKIQKKLLMIHVTGQPEDVQYWRVAILDDLEVKSLLVSALHSVQYSAHLRVQRTISKVRCYFWWKVEMCAERNGKKRERERKLERTRFFPFPVPTNFDQRKSVLPTLSANIFVIRHLFSVLFFATDSSLLCASVVS